MDGDISFVMGITPEGAPTPPPATECFLSFLVVGGHAAAQNAISAVPTNAPDPGCTSSVDAFASASKTYVHK